MRRGNRDDLLVHGDAIQHGDRVPNLPAPCARTISACCPSSRQRAQPAWNAREFAAVHGNAHPWSWPRAETRRRFWLSRGNAHALA